MCKYWPEKSGAAVDGEHPERGLSHQGEFAPPECTEGSKHDFHAPANGAAFYKIIERT